jgi:hypothetical protein
MDGLDEEKGYCDTLAAGDVGGGSSYREGDGGGEEKDVEGVGEEVRMTGTQCPCSASLRDS